MYENIVDELNRTMEDKIIADTLKVENKPNYYNMYSLKCKTKHRDHIEQKIAELIDQENCMFNINNYLPVI